MHRPVRIFMFLIPTIFVLLWFNNICIADSIIVSEHVIMRDGSPWTPRGVTVISFLAPINNMTGPQKKSYEQFGVAFLQQAQAFGADTIRFQVSQPGLDEQSPIYDQEYRNSIRNAVQMARSRSLAVIISMQWQHQAGLEPIPGFPTESTTRAWKSLLEVIPDDQGIMFELFNEPTGKHSDSEVWRRWQFTMQSLVDIFRERNIKNVLLLDGIETGKTFAGAPSINDPLHNIAFAVHPYFVSTNKDRSDWDRNFGAFSTSHAVLATEWNASSTVKCVYATPPRVTEFLQYLAERKIGLVMWALGVGQTIYGRNGQLVDFPNLQCGVPGAGAARMVSDYFHSQQ